MLRNAKLFIGFFRRKQITIRPRYAYTNEFVIRLLLLPWPFINFISQNELWDQIYSGPKIQDRLTCSDPDPQNTLWRFEDNKRVYGDARTLATPLLLF